MTDRIPFDVNFAEADAHFADVVVMTPEEYAAAADWARARGFTVATMSKAEMLQDALDAVRDTVGKGWTLAQFQEAFDDIMADRGWIGSTPWHVETVMRTNTQTAYGSGRWQQIQAVKDVFPFLQYITGPRPRETHESKDGIVQPVNSEFWRRYQPPWDFNCNCSSEALTEEEAREAGFDGVDIFNGVKDDLPTNGFLSPATSIEYRPDLSGIDPEIAAAAQNDLSGYEPKDED